MIHRSQYFELSERQKRIYKNNRFTTGIFSQELQRIPRTDAKIEIALTIINKIHSGVSKIQTFKSLLQKKINQTNGFFNVTFPRSR